MLKPYMSTGSHMRVFFSLLLTASIGSALGQAKRTFVTVKKNNSECIIDLDRNELIPSGKYINIWTAYDGGNRLFVVTAPNMKRGLYLLGEREVIPCVYDDIGMFSRGYGSIKKDNKWALVNRKFERITGFVFEEQPYFYNGKASTKKDGRYIIIDSLGQVLKELPYDYMPSLGTQGLYKMAKINNAWGYIDREGNEVVPCVYEMVEQGVDIPLFPVKKNGKWGYVNKNNEVVIPFKFAITRAIRDGIGLMQNEKFQAIGAIDEKGNIIYDESKYEDIAYSNEGKYKVRKNGRWGYIDSINYGEIITARFTSCDNFYNGVAVVELDGFANVIDTAGNLLLPQRYHRISNWGHVLVVVLNNKVGMIDRSGRLIVPIEYDNLAYGGAFATIQKNKLWGIVKYDATILIQPKYDQIRSIDGTHFLATKDNRSYIVDMNGKETPVE